MELHFSHASRVLATRPLPLEATRLTLTGNQPKLTRLFAKRFERLTRLGLLGLENTRLVDRRPVKMKDANVQWTPEHKAKVRSTKTAEYNHPGLTKTQCMCMTETTKGKAMDMKNKIAEHRAGRKVRYLANQAADA